MCYVHLCASADDQTPSTYRAELSKHGVHVHTAFPHIDHVHPMLELLQDPSETKAATGEGGGEGEVRAAVKRWYSSAMESKHTKTLLKSNL